MQSITVPAIAFTAAIVCTFTQTRLLADPFTQARHALTADGKFTWANSGTRFSYLRFYHAIIKTVSGWTELEQKQLIEWWNGYVSTHQPILKLSLRFSLTPSIASYPQPSLVASPRELSRDIPIGPSPAQFCRRAHASTTIWTWQYLIILHPCPQTARPYTGGISCTILPLTNIIGFLLLLFWFPRDPEFSAYCLVVWCSSCVPWNILKMASKPVTRSS